MSARKNNAVFPPRVADCPHLANCMGARYRRGGTVELLADETVKCSGVIIARAINCVFIGNDNQFGEIVDCSVTGSNNTIHIGHNINASGPGLVVHNGCGLMSVTPLRQCCVDTPQCGGNQVRDSIRYLVRSKQMYSPQVHRTEPTFIEALRANMESRIGPMMECFAIQRAAEQRFINTEYSSMQQSARYAPYGAAATAARVEQQQTTKPDPKSPTPTTRSTLAHGGVQDKGITKDKLTGPTRRQPRKDPEAKKVRFGPSDKDEPSTRDYSSL